MSYHLVYKPKWRWVGQTSHCFMRDRRNGGYESLCGKHRRKMAGGGKCLRPPALARCPRCDIEEMELLRKEESLPESPNWSTG